MRKIISALILPLIFGLLLSLSLVNAITPQEISEAKSLIDSKADCESLSDSQLEILGEYYMEQMHPGESHELMHKMMGLTEGSDAEEQFHITMAKTIYCGESGGLIGSSGMMSSGTTGMFNMMSNGMIGNYGYGSGYWSFLNILYMILLIGLIILVYFWIIKLWKSVKNKTTEKNA